MSDEVLGLAARIERVLRAPNVDTLGIPALISNEAWDQYRTALAIAGFAGRLAGIAVKPQGWPAACLAPFEVMAQQWALIPAALAAWEQVAKDLPDSATDLDRAYRAEHRARRLREQAALLQPPEDGAPVLQVAGMALWKVAGVAGLLMAASDAEALAERVPLGEAKDLRAAAQSKRATAGEITEVLDGLGDAWQEYVLDLQPAPALMAPVPTPVPIGKW